MRFDEIRIGHRGLRPNGSEFQVCGIDDADQTIMDELGTWYDFRSCDFPKYHF